MRIRRPNQRCTRPEESYLVPPMAKGPQATPPCYARPMNAPLQKGVKTEASDRNSGGRFKRIWMPLIAQIVIFALSTLFVIESVSVLESYSRLLGIESELLIYALGIVVPSALTYLVAGHRVGCFFNRYLLFPLLPLGYLFLCYWASMSVPLSNPIFVFFTFAPGLVAGTFFGATLRGVLKVLWMPIPFTSSNKREAKRKLKKRMKRLGKA